MKAERWQKLDELFHLALEREADARADFVAQASDGDEDLRRELESMLAHYEAAKSFIESPAYAVAAETIVEDAAPERLIGTNVGPYRILDVLGTGGMGVVYRALDQELQRKVALKFLHSELTCDKLRILRFKQEARAASALNHPNILTVYAIGEIEGRHYISTELVEGVTLRELMKSKQMNLNQILSVTSQISSALLSAHRAGIIHRDIKPENIMLRPDGYLKVLDFGVAKLIEPSAGDSEQSTLINTEQGTIIGTIQYMSPEQARGLDVDARTDIWSLGVVFFEMLVGHPPFEGKTKSDVMVAILERDPPCLADPNAPTSEAVQEIVTRALTKERGKRYQSAEELLTALRQLEQSNPRLDLQRPLLPHVNRHLVAETAKQHAKATDDPAAIRPVSSAEYIVSEIKQHKLSAGAIALALLAITTSVGLWVSGLVKRNSLTSLSKPMSITRLTTSGRARDAVISPDGKYVAYTVDEAGKRNLRLRQIGTTSDIEIAAEVDYGRLTFSRDGSYLYYNSFFQGDLYQLPSIGGSPTLVLKNVDSAITFSPDGKRFAFVRHDYPTQGESALLIANADGTGEQKLVSRKGSYKSPAWSPDGKVIAAAVPTPHGGIDYMGVVQIELEGGRESPINSQRWLELEAVTWFADGSGLLLLANDRSIFSEQLWQLSYPGGEARRVTNDFNNYERISVNAESTNLVSVQRTPISNIWILSDQAGSVPIQVTSGAGAYFDLSWTPDDKLLYASDSGGSWNIWALDTTGPSARQITLNGGQNGEPSVSPDGRQVVFASTLRGVSDIWRMDADGGNAKQLTSGHDDNHPTWSPDGRWVLFERTLSGGTTVWRVSSEGDKPTQVTDKPAAFPVVSPEGNLIACTYKDNPDNNQWKVAVIPFAGGPPLKLFDIPPPFFTAPFKWTLDGKALTYLATKQSGVDGVDNLWIQPLDGGLARQLTNFTSENIFSFAWSRSGKLAISRGVETGDVVLISDFR